MSSFLLNKNAWEMKLETFFNSEVSSALSFFFCFQKQKLNLTSVCENDFNIRECRKIVLNEGKMTEIHPKFFKNGLGSPATCTREHFCEIRS